MTLMSLYVSMNSGRIVNALKTFFKESDFISLINNTEQASYSDKYQYSYTVCKNSLFYKIQFMCNALDTGLEVIHFIVPI